MLGFKRFDHAAVTISGIELTDKIKKVPVQDRCPRGSGSDHVGTVEGCAGCLIYWLCSGVCG